MASTLFRTSTLQGSAFRRVLSAAAAAAPSGGEGLTAHRAAPLRRLFHSGAPGDQPPKSLDEKVYKVDQMQRQVDELNKLIERDIYELLERYKNFQTEDHGYFERFLTRCGMAKSKFRDDFIWRCEIATLFVLSAGVGCLLADIRS
ncbi:uncharacterized protein LOC133922344 [Phragmites australis]|uniref:uncharacterized protein LOC133922344 n=1 Tax=Phragmites australis TaxID=29695 RepID=UPI002D781C7B|nr:uncharacterized protein LOC133922344 [Phragmites australis]